MGEKTLGEIENSDMIGSGVSPCSTSSEPFCAHGCAIVGFRFQAPVVCAIWESAAAQSETVDRFALVSKPVHYAAEEHAVVAVGARLPLAEIEPRAPSAIRDRLTVAGRERR